MRLRLLVVAALLGVLATPHLASADATLFFGRNSAGDDRAMARGFAIGAGMLFLGFEFEYSNSSEDQDLARPSLRTTSGNIAAQTWGLPGFQLYFTTGVGYYRERLGADEESALTLNTGGGAKINVGGPIRARVDYRMFSLKGNPRHDRVHRIYAGLNLSF